MAFFCKIHKYIWNKLSMKKYNELIMWNPIGILNHSRILLKVWIIFTLHISQYKSVSNIQILNKAFRKIFREEFLDLPNRTSLIFQECRGKKMNSCCLTFRVYQSNFRSWGASYVQWSWNSITNFNETVKQKSD